MHKIFFNTLRLELRFHISFQIYIFHVEKNLIPYSFRFISFTSKKYCYLKKRFEHILLIVILFFLTHSSLLLEKENSHLYFFSLILSLLFPLFMTAYFRLLIFCRIERYPKTKNIRLMQETVKIPKAMIR